MPIAYCLNYKLKFDLQSFLIYKKLLIIPNSEFRIIHLPP